MDSEQLLKKDANSAEQIFLDSLKLLDLTPISPEIINIQDQQVLKPCGSENSSSIIPRTINSKDESVNIIKIEEISNEDEEEQQNDTNNAGAPVNSQEINCSIKKKRKSRNESKHILDNVEVNKLKNFYKTFMNRISVILKIKLKKDKTMAYLIDEICQHSNQRSFLDLFPHLKPYQEDNSSSCYYTYKHVSQLKQLRKIAFKLLGLKFNQMVRIVKSSRSFTQTEEFIYGCLYFAERSESFHRNQNFPPDIFEIVSAEKPFVNFEFHEPIWGQNAKEGLIILEQEEESCVEEQIPNKETQEKQQQQQNQQQNEGQKQEERKKQNIQIQVNDMEYHRMREKHYSYSEGKINQYQQPYQYQQFPAEKEEQIQFFQGLTIKSNGVIEFQKITPATGNQHQSTSIFNLTAPIRHLGGNQESVSSFQY